MNEVSLNINPIYCRKSDVDSATKKKHLKVLTQFLICIKWRILQILEIHYIVDHVNTCKYWRHTQYVESFYTRNGQYITWSLALFDRIKSVLNIDKEKTSTYIPRLKQFPDGKLCLFDQIDFLRDLEDVVYTCYHLTS